MRVSSRLAATTVIACGSAFVGAGTAAALPLGDVADDQNAVTSAATPGVRVPLGLGDEVGACSNAVVQTVDGVADQASLSSLVCEEKAKEKKHKNDDKPVDTGPEGNEDNEDTGAGNENAGGSKDDTGDGLTDELDDDKGSVDTDKTSDGSDNGPVDTDKTSDGSGNGPVDTDGASGGGNYVDNDDGTTMLPDQDDGAIPEGPINAGAGGTADGDAQIPAALASGTLIAAGGALLTRRRFARHRRSSRHAA